VSLDTRRNRIAQKLANAALWLATGEYRDMIAGAICYGMRSAALDANRGEYLVFDHIKGEVRRERHAQAAR
jgi:hypothetical protein